MMSIYEELRADHEDIQDLLDLLAQAEEPDERKSLITQIRDLLVPHSRAEEAVLYNSLRDLDQSKDVVTHSYQEHIKAETLLRALQVTEAVALHWQSGVEKLRDELDHHIEHEETTVFAAAQGVLSNDDADALGKAFSQFKEKLGAGFLVSQIELLANIMPQRFRKTFVDFLSGETSEKQKAS
jgi:hemerythrin superfamily protein